MNRQRIVTSDDLVIAMVAIAFSAGFGCIIGVRVDVVLFGAFSAAVGVAILFGLADKGRP